MGDPVGLISVLETMLKERK
uniref:Uncharacterized protein n=1 Tax=Rhizophora mucronata TaxID=61149 RepID=A0A2P2P4B8_RHIMU